MLLGRRSDCAKLDRLLSDARAGHSGALVLRGEAGIGKTALLRYAIESASDCAVARAIGVESEMELPFAALHQVCAPMLDRLELLPAPQRDALGTVFGVTVGSVPDRFMVGLAVLSLLAEAAGERALLCVVDDAQWLDRASAQALAFAARRLDAESVALLFATRQECEDFRGLPELMVGGLAEADARELLTSVVHGPLDERVRDRIVAETRGNPLALVELPRGLSAAELAGGFAVRNAPQLSSRIEESFLRRLEELPDETQPLVLLAAAEPAGDPALVWRAAEQLRLHVDAEHHAEAAGLLEIGARVRFRHPLVRSGVYRSATPADRRQVHWALAEATDPELDPDRRAWHRAQATTRPDEDVAAELERSAGRAQARGGLTAAAAFLERAVELTVEPGCRAQRALAAAHAAHLAGRPDAAERLLATAQVGPLDELGHGRMEVLRAQTAYAQKRGSEAPSLLLKAAKRLEPLDVRLARDTYLDALATSMFVGRMPRGAGPSDVARAALSAPNLARPRAADVLLDGFATRLTAGYGAGAPILKRALSMYPTGDDTDEESLRWMWLAAIAAVSMWDDRMWELLAARQLQLARDAGALTLLPVALNHRIGAHAFAGELVAATTLVGEVQAAQKAIESRFPPYGALVVAAWRGRETDATELIDASMREAADRGEAAALAIAHWARATLFNSLGDYRAALAAAEQASELPRDIRFYDWSLAELVLAAARSGRVDRAAQALRQLTAITGASGTDWALGIEARSRALLSDGAVAEGLYQDAIDRLGRTRIRVELARAHLFYGEWLRRERRRADAREHLHAAREMSIAMGTEAFAEHAERELLATGETVRKRTAETRDDLTAQEAQIARLAREGLSNPEIGERLFISPRTVEYHLHKVFSKLDITSRNQLNGAMPPEPTAVVGG
jgi:DNA-binding CsgD family transcriptional regulator